MEFVRGLSAQIDAKDQTIAAMDRAAVFKTARIAQPTYELAQYKPLRFGKSSEGPMLFK